LRTKSEELKIKDVRELNELELRTLLELEIKEKELFPRNLRKEIREEIF